MRSLRRRSARSGFTLLETCVALALFSAVGYSLTLALDASQRSQHAVLSMASDARAQRAVTAQLLEELGSTSDARIAVSVLSDGNHRVRFPLPIQVGATDDWGVHDVRLGSDDATQTHAGWNVQYRVQSALVNGTGVRQLVREVVDENGAVQLADVRLSDLCDGDGARPGFHVVQTGAVWVVTICTQSGTSGHSREEFHVHARN